METGRVKLNRGTAAILAVTWMAIAILSPSCGRRGQQGNNFDAESRFLGESHHPYVRQSSGRHHQCESDRDIDERGQWGLEH